MNCGCRRDESSADDAYDVIQESYSRGYQAGRKSLTLLLKNIIAYWNCGEVEELKELEEQNEKLYGLLVYIKLQLEKYQTWEGQHWRQDHVPDFVATKIIRRINEDQALSEEIEK